MFNEFNENNQFVDILDRLFALATEANPKQSELLQKAFGCEFKKFTKLASRADILLAALASEDETWNDYPPCSDLKKALIDVHWNI